MLYKSGNKNIIESSQLRLCLLIFLYLNLTTFLHAAPFFYFDYVDENEGIFNGNIEDIAQDRDGYIWFATQSGIYKYDGLSSQAYQRDGEAGSLLNDDVFDILVSSDNTLWVGTNGAGLARLDRNTGTFMHISSDTTHARIAHFRVQKLKEYNNKILVVTDLGIEALDPVTLLSKRYALIDSEGKEIFDYYPGNLVSYREGLLTVVAGKLYFLEAGTNVFRHYTFPEYRHYAYETKSEQFKVFEGSKNTVFIHSDDGVFLIDQRNKVIKREPFFYGARSDEKVTIRNITIDRHGTHWLATRNQGLFYRFSENNSYQKIEIGNGRNQLNTDLILSFFIDIDNNIWIGTDGMYSAKFRAPQDLFPFYSNYHEADLTLHTNSVWSFAEWNDKTYVATHKGLFELNKNNNPVLKPVLVGPKFHSNYDIAVVDDDLLLTTRQGLYRYQKNGVVTNITRSVLDLNESTKELLAIDFAQVEASEDYVFIGTYEGLIVLDKRTQTTSFYHSGGDGQYALKDNWVWLLKYDVDKQWLWIGTTSGVEVRAIGENAESTVRANEVLSTIKDTINDVFLHSNGEAWIASSQGLFRFTAEQKVINYKHFTEGVIRSIQIHKDQIWLSTDMGMIQAFLQDTSNFRYFIPEDGVYNLMNSDGASFYSASNDVLYFGGNRGVLEVKNDELLQAEPVRKPVLEQVFLITSAPYKDILRPLLQGQALENAENSLRFHYAYLDYKAPHRIRFQHKLVGFDTGWSEISENNSVPYTNLPSGKYQLYLRAYNANNLVSEDELVLEFTINKPWWRSSLAHLFYALFSALLVIYFIRHLGSRNLRQRQVQLQRKKQEFISSYSEYSVLLASLSSYQAMAKHFLDRVLFVTGATYVVLKQTLLEEIFESNAGDEKNTKFQNKIEQSLFFGENESQLILSGVNDEDLLDLSGDINLLYQQMILAQDNLIERTKYKWSQYHDSRTGLYTRGRFCNILQEEIVRAEAKNLVQVLLFWEVNSDDFLQNNLIERIHLMKYGELIKESLGKHVVATYCDGMQHWLDKPHSSGFVVYLGDMNDQQVKEVSRKIRELIKVYRNQQPSANKNKPINILQINDIASMRALCESNENDESSN